MMFFRLLNRMNRLEHKIRPKNSKTEVLTIWSLSQTFDNPDDPTLSYCHLTMLFLSSEDKWFRS